MKILINPRHERFAQLVAAGFTQADAYRQVFPKSRKWKVDNAVHSKASQLMAKVEQRVQEIQQAFAAKLSVAKDEVVCILAESIRGANPADIPPEKAVDLLAKLQGWYAPVKVESEAKGVPGAKDCLETVRGLLAKIRAMQGPRVTES